MALHKDAHVIGLTGSFGSGCTTAASFLKTSMDFHSVGLSGFIKQRWESDHQGEKASRKDLQRLGDELRIADGSSYLAVLAHKEVDGLPDSVERVVIDGIRNTGEVDYLRGEFGFRFTLVAVMADHETRWERLGEQYVDAGMSENDFFDDDARDQNEETESGQEVELCIDAADVMIDNGQHVTRTEYRRKVRSFAEQAMGLRSQYATPDEVFMHQAFSSRHGSKCIKRRVGAVLVDTNGWVVAGGFNENPTGTKPCVEEPMYQKEGPCFRDILRNKHFESLGSRNARCPECGEAFGLVHGPPWYCPVCELQGIRTNLEKYFMPDRAMNSCTAIHAEVAALISAGERARGGTLYCTTFPCMQCSEKLIHYGVRRIVFTEAYADMGGLERLQIADVELVQFEGIRSSAFERFYGRLPIESR